MLKKISFGLIFSLCITSVSHAFDLEDYATTFRGTRDAYLKAANERSLAEGPFSSAFNAWYGVEMVEQLSRGDGAAVERLMLMKVMSNQCRN